MTTPRLDAIAGYVRAIKQACVDGRSVEVERDLARNDLFYLLCVLCGRPDINRDWLFDRCREVEASPDGHLDLWAREHGKSSLITFGLTIRDILRNPEITVGIFSFNRPIAKQFLRQIKREFEANSRLRELFPEIIWDNPSKQAPKWSEDDGIIVRRVGNPKESTIEAWGLVDGQPTSKHFWLMVYDDPVTADSVTTPDMIAKVTRAWEASLNLTTEGGAIRYIGTRWAHNDTYRTIIDRGAAIERRHPATADGTADGDPVLMSREYLAGKRAMGTYTFGAQMLLDPTADRAQGFREEWLRYHDTKIAPDGPPAGMNCYMLVDAASEKKRQSDYTAMAIIGLAADGNYYLLDMVRDRLRLTERGDAVFALHRRWKPRGVGYERYGMMADIEYIKDRMGRENYRFEIAEVGGQIPKPDRIKRLVPVFEAGRFYLPETIGKIDCEGKWHDLVQSILNEEYRVFPLGAHDDMLDAISRIFDISTVWPKPAVNKDDERYARKRDNRRAASAWAA